MTDNDQSTTISQESFDREKRQREAAESKVAELTGTLTSYTKRDAARAFFRGKVADPDAIADLVTPHLADVELANVGTFLEGERFKPLIVGSPLTPPPTDGDLPPADGSAPSPEGNGQTPAIEPPGGFGGPSPGGVTGSQSLGTKTMIKVGSPEYQEAIRTNNVDQIEKWDKEGLIERPARPF